MPLAEFIVTDHSPGNERYSAAHEAARGTPGWVRRQEGQSQPFLRVPCSRQARPGKIAWAWLAWICHLWTVASGDGVRLPGA